MTAMLCRRSPRPGGNAVCVQTGLGSKSANAFGHLFFPAQRMNACLEKNRLRCLTGRPQSGDRRKGVRLQCAPAGLGPPGGKDVRFTSSSTTSFEQGFSSAPGT